MATSDEFVEPLILDVLWPLLSRMILFATVAEKCNRLAPAREPGTFSSSWHTLEQRQLYDIVGAAELGNHRCGRNQ